MGAIMSMLSSFPQPSSIIVSDHEEIEACLIRLSLYMPGKYCLRHILVSRKVGKY